MEFVVLVADFGEVLLGHVVDPGREVSRCDEECSLLRLEGDRHGVERGAPPY